MSLSQSVSHLRISLNSHSRRKKTASYQCPDDVPFQLTHPPASAITVLGCRSHKITSFSAQQVILSYFFPLPIFPLPALKWNEIHEENLCAAQLAVFFVFPSILRSQSSGWTSLFSPSQQQGVLLCCCCDNFHWLTDKSRAERAKLTAL